MKKKRRSVKMNVFLSLVLAISLFSTSTASAAYYNTYTTKTLINNSTYTMSEGFAVGSTYAYTAKLNGSGTQAILIKTNLGTGENFTLTDSGTGKAYATYLGHANDMAVCTIDSKSNLFIVDSDSNKLVKVKVDGRKFSKEATYEFYCNGQAQSISAIDIVSKTDSSITFVCKKAKEIFIGSVAPNAASGKINLTKKFNLNVTDALVNGEKVPNLSKYTNQGMCYSSGDLYVPLTGKGVGKKNVSIVLVYPNIMSSTSTTLKADSATSYRITSKEFELFEIESCGIQGGKLWFNTNRAKGGEQADGIHYFNN